MLNQLSLFTGYGGFSLGLRLAGLQTRTVMYVEWERYPQEVIKARIKDGFLDDAPIWGDISTLDGQQLRGVVDLITAGFPCQPHSFAGKRKGEADERNLWPDTLRVISEVGPDYVLLENVPGILANGYAGTVVGELSELGYDCRWGLVAAATVGAPHLRWRWWCIGTNARVEGDAPRSITDSLGSYHTEIDKYGSAQFRDKQECELGSVGGAIPDAADDGCAAWGRASQQECEYETMGRREQPGPNGKTGEVAHADGQPRPERNEQSQTRQPAPHRNDSSRCSLQSWWATEPDVGRVANGVAARVDRLKALGNGLVPAVVAEFLRQSHA